VTEQTTCFRTNCDRPSTLCELDHRDPWPAGPTDTANLQPACKVDHKAKHPPGFSIDQAADGSMVLVTAAGFRHGVRRTEHPASTRRAPGEHPASTRRAPGEHPASTAWPDLPEVQFSASGFVAVLTELRDRRDIVTAEQAALAWEHQIGQSLQALLAG
jgi:hypothetical protein